jgi:acetyl-CoA carboxylase beta subunit
MDDLPAGEDRVSEPEIKVAFCDRHPIIVAEVNGPVRMQAANGSLVTVSIAQGELERMRAAQSPWELVAALAAVIARGMQVQ